MSHLPFLDNAKTGKNNWWRYLFTVVGSIGLASIAAGLLLAFIVVVLTVLSHPVISPGMVNNLISLNNPLLIVLITGVTYALSFFLFYLLVRFLHHKNFKILINYGVGFRWGMFLKGALIWFVILSLLSLPDFILNPGAYQVSLNSEAFYWLLVLSVLAFPVQASFEEILFRETKQKISSKTQHRVTLVTTDCLTSWSSRCPQFLSPLLTILPCGGAWPCRHNTNKARILRKLHF